jgi:hypothetical protein
MQVHVVSTCEWLEGTRLRLLHYFFLIQGICVRENKTKELFPPTPKTHGHKLKERLSFCFFLVLAHLVET